MSGRIFTPEQAARVVIVGGSTYPEHAESAAGAVGAEATDPHSRQFPNTELTLEYADVSLRGKDVFIVQTDAAERHRSLEGRADDAPWSVNDSIMETVIMVDAAHRASASSVTVVKPQFGYGRQDRKKHGREPVSAIAHIDIMASVGMDRLLVIDAHSQQTISHHPLADNLSAVDGLQLATKDYLEGESIDPEDVMFIAPDGGSLSLPEHFADHLGGKIDVMAKTRDKEGGVKHAERVENVGGRTCVLVDDMIDTAGTLKSAIEILRRSGAEKIVVAATHGIFSEPALERLSEAEVDKIIVSDTVPQVKSAEALGSRLKVVKIAPLIGAAIFEIATNGSISSIFRDGKAYSR